MSIFKSGIFADPPRNNRKQSGIVDRIAFSNHIGGGLGMGTYGETTCHLLLKDRDRLVALEPMAFETGGDSAVHLTQVGDLVHIETTDDGEIVHFSNETTGLKARVE